MLAPRLLKMTAKPLPTRCNASAHSGASSSRKRLGLMWRSRPALGRLGMGGEWREVKADECCSSVRDGTHDSPKPVDFGRFLVTSRHIIGGRLDLAKAYLISQHDFDAINKRSKVDRWDVLISMIGTVGEP